jgi:hypothetical protein
MHPRELVDVAAMVALHGPLLIEGRSPPAEAELEQYWSASKCRAENWGRLLKAADLSTQAVLQRDLDRWVEIRAVLDEIFVSEIVTRLWTAVLVACDRRTTNKTAEPIARSVLASHMEARHRALALLMHDEALTTEQAVAANRLRRRCERWTDALLGGLWHVDEAREFAFDPERAADFQRDLSRRRGVAGGKQAWRLLLVSLRNAFQGGLFPTAANPESNVRIAASIVGSFPGDVFDSTGVFRSLWMVRMAAVASDAQGLITQLLETEQTPADSRSVFRTKRWQ